MADYAVNPLGVKSKPEVRDALDRWVDAAQGLASHLIVACNTASDAPQVGIAMVLLDLDPPGDNLHGAF